MEHPVVNNFFHTFSWIILITNDTMCIYKRCCCCCSVLVGAKIIAIIGLVIGFINFLGDILIVLKENGYSIPDLFLLFWYLVWYFPLGAFAVYFGGIWMMIIAITVTLAWMSMDALLLYGIIKKKPVFLMPWLIFHQVFSIVSIKVVSTGCSISECVF